MAYFQDAFQHKSDLLLVHVKRSRNPDKSFKLTFTLSRGHMKMGQDNWGPMDHLVVKVCAMCLG